MGSFALYNNVSGHGNTATGLNALGQNTTGHWSTAFGFHALASNTTGQYNTAVGSYALHATHGSQYNTAIGYFAGKEYNMGYNNTLIGAQADINQNGLFNCVALGQAAKCTGSSQVRFGNTSTVSIGGYVNYSNISDGRFKRNVRETVKGLDFVMKLRPVTYNLDITGLNEKLDIAASKDEQSQKAITEKETMLFSGFIAQEVEQAAKETGYDFSGVDKPKNEKDLYALRYADFVVPLVKAIQEQQQQIDELKKRIAELEKSSTVSHSEPGGFTVITHVSNYTNEITFTCRAATIRTRTNSGPVGHNGGRTTGCVRQYSIELKQYSPYQ